ncbi:MAG: leucine-rich repeat domain-containing protein [Candidatus Thorarchaeota archaeon]
MNDTSFKVRTSPGKKFLEVNYSSVEDIHFALERFSSDLNSHAIDMMKICFAFHDASLNKVIRYSSAERGPVDLSPLEHVPNLKELLLFDLADVDTIDLSTIASLTGLELFAISGALYEGILESIDLTPLKYCRHLRLFEISSQKKLSKVDIEPLAGCDSLESFTLGNSPVHELDLKPIAKKSLKELDLSRLELETIDLSPLSIAGLESLDLDSNMIREIDLSPLDMTCLKRISLRNNKISMIDLSVLHSSTAIKEISLKGNSLHSVDLSSLAGKDTLYLLEIHKNPLGPIDITPLVSCKNLSHLFIDDNVELVSHHELGKDIPEALEQYSTRVRLL